MAQAVKAAALAGTKQSALGLARSIDRRLAGWIGLAVGAAFVLGATLTFGACMVSGIGRFSPDAGAPSPRAIWNWPTPTPLRRYSNQGRRAAGHGATLLQMLALWATPAPPPRGQ